MITSTWSYKPTARCEHCEFTAHPSSTVTAKAKKHAKDNPGHLVKVERRSETHYEHHEPRGVVSHGAVLS